MSRAHFSESAAAKNEPGSFSALFAAEVAEYLRRMPRQLPSKYFYDPLGSALFEAICRLPWYSVTRAESALLAAHAPALLGDDAAPLTIAELGCGSGDKLATLIERGTRQVDTVQLIDVSAAALAMATTRLDHLPIARIVAHQHTYAEGLRHAADSRGDGPMLVLFLGSNIGNFDPPADACLLRSIRECLRPGDALLLGTDLVKPERELLLAYDDPLQITAAFNRNLLRRINDELGGTFDLDGFVHRACWNGREHRVEMHLVSTRAQEVRVAATDLVLEIAEGESIWTESSYKYEPEEILAAGAAAGFAHGEQWIDQVARFALTRFAV